MKKGIAHQFFSAACPRLCCSERVNLCPASFKSTLGDVVVLSAGARKSRLKIVATQLAHRLVNEQVALQIAFSSFAAEIAFIASVADLEPPALDEAPSSLDSSASIASSLRLSSNAEVPEAACVSALDAVSFL